MARTNHFVEGGREPRRPTVVVGLLERMNAPSPSQAPEERLESDAAERRTVESSMDYALEWPDEAHGRYSLVGRGADQAYN